MIGLGGRCRVRCMTFFVVVSCEIWLRFMETKEDDDDGGLLFYFYCSCIKSKYTIL